MKRLVWVLGLGVLCGSTVQAAADRQHLEEVRMASVTNEPFAIPSGYGHLVSVAVKSEIHYLYFEDATGAVRVVLIGPRGSAQRARNDLQLLTPEVFLMTRGEGEIFAVPHS